MMDNMTVACECGAVHGETHTDACQGRRKLADHASKKAFHRIEEAGLPHKFPCCGFVFRSVGEPKFCPGCGASLDGIAKPAAQNECMSLEALRNDGLFQECAQGAMEEAAIKLKPELAARQVDYRAVKRVLGEMLWSFLGSIRGWSYGIVKGNPALNIAGGKWSTETPDLRKSLREAARRINESTNGAFIPRHMPFEEVLNADPIVLYIEPPRDNKLANDAMYEAARRLHEQTGRFVALVPISDKTTREMASRIHRMEQACEAVVMAADWKARGQSFSVAAEQEALRKCEEALQSDRRDYGPSILQQAMPLLVSYEKLKKTLLGQDKPLQTSRNLEDVVKAVEPPRADDPVLKLMKHQEKMVAECFKAGMKEVDPVNMPGLYEIRLPAAGVTAKAGETISVGLASDPAIGDRVTLRRTGFEGTVVELKPEKRQCNVRLNGGCTIVADYDQLVVHPYDHQKVPSPEPEVNALLGFDIPGGKVQRNADGSVSVVREGAKFNEYVQKVEPKKTSAIVRIECDPAHYASRDETVISVYYNDYAAGVFERITEVGLTIVQIATRLIEIAQKNRSSPLPLQIPIVLTRGGVAEALYDELFAFGYNVFWPDTLPASLKGDKPASDPLNQSDLTWPIATDESWPTLQEAMAAASNNADEADPEKVLAATETDPFGKAEPVRLKSGGPTMYVESIGTDGKLRCRWTKPSGLVEHGEFAPECVEAA